jgi:hypothetical protein
MAEGRVSRWCVDPVWPKRGDTAVCGSGVGPWPCAAQGTENPAEWSSDFADLRGGDLPGWLFF